MTPRVQFWVGFTSGFCLVAAIVITVVELVWENGPRFWRRY